MRILHVTLIDQRIVHCGINLHMPQEPLRLFGHPLVNGPGGEGSPKFVRIHLGHGRLPAKFYESCFHSPYHQAFMRLCQRNKQGRVVVCPAVKIVFQVDFGSGVKKDSQGRDFFLESPGMPPSLTSPLQGR
jgi:hypothetical protein